MKKGNNVALFLAAVLAFTFFAGVIPATAEGGVQHIEKTLESPFLKLELNADVSVPKENTQLTIYETDYARSDAAKWIEMFFDSADAAVEDGVNGQANEKRNLFYPEIERKYGEGDVYTRYIAYEARVYVDYREHEVTDWWNMAKVDSQAEGLKTIPDQAKTTALEWTNRLASTIGWDGLTLSACYTMPAAFPGVVPGATPDPQYVGAVDTNPTGFYIVEFNRVLSGIPVAIDKLPYSDDTKADLYGDVLQVYIDDDGIFRVRGYYRSFVETKKEPMTISLDDAIQILQDNMDYVAFYPEEATSVISEIGLCYRLVQILDTSDKDVNARTEARPAWRFASSVNRNMSDVFVIFIDAVTGEVLP
ncbi:MAG: hypothetical protein GXY67_05985 [Clostridiales bacterium]|nr:hypothetical protein [Clostridiales bacterium]